MKIKIFSFGKPKFSFLDDAIFEFENRIKKLVNFESIIMKEIPFDLNNKDKCLLEESKAIFKFYQENVSTFLLVENSKEFTSIEFSKAIEQKFLKMGNEIHFFIGSSHGFHDVVKDKIKSHLSLSPMTFTHDMARFLLLEQVYRALTILKKIPYHH